MENQIMPDRVTYSESRSINIGDYEQIQSFLSFSSNVTSHGYGKNREATVKISAKETKEAIKSLEKTARLLKKRVRKILDKEERKIRKWSDSFVSFETEDKMPEKDKIRFEK